MDHQFTSHPVVGKKGVTSHTPQLFSFHPLSSSSSSSSSSFQWDMEVGSEMKWISDHLMDKYWNNNKKKKKNDENENEKKNEKESKHHSSSPSTNIMR